MLGQVADRVLGPAELRIGDANQQNYALTHVGELTIGTNGDIFVAQPLDAVVRVFDSDGHFVRQIGRRGAGPGEFRYPLKLGWHGSNLWVWDRQLIRISFFTEGGESVGSARVPGAARYLASGSFLVQRFWEPAEGLGVLPLQIVNDQTAATDTVAVLNVRNVNLQLSFGAGMVTGRQPFDDSTLWNVSPAGDAIYIVDRTVKVGSVPTFTVKRLDTAGRPVWTQTYGYEPIRVSAAVLDHIAAAIADSMMRTAPARIRNQARITPDAVRENLWRPDHLPAVMDVVVDTDKTVWLRKGTLQGDPPEWYVIDGDGTLRMTVRGEPGFNIRAVRGETAWGVETDSLGIPYIVRRSVQ